MAFEALGNLWNRVVDGLKTTKPGLETTAEALAKKYSKPGTDGD
ncbi:MAG: hypothetical protein Greene07147_42 [Parcubacteria group bacterium Greene0714_7]|nr:MAG: hypothetical protein Greene07147_42 [Parcubacteria group bacterium Greene0714_7]